MRSRLFLAVAGSIVLMLAAGGAVVAYDSAQRNHIARGITVGGVDVGGMSVEQARSRLAQAYATRLSHPLLLRFHRRTFVVRPSALKLSVNVSDSLQQALERSRAENLFSRVYRSLTGGTIRARINPELRFSAAGVRRVVRHVAGALDRRARNAAISYSGSSIGSVESRPGVAVDQVALAGRIESALRNANARRVVRVPAGAVRPAVTTAQLAARNATIITVDRNAFRLRLWKHLRLVKTYTIAVGMAGLETPAGLYHVQNKEVDPSWHVPNSAWAGSLAGQTIPPGPADPIKARWMGIFNGAGIHGTDELGSLGSAASHGCIRMAIPDVVELYDQTPVGAPVYIA